MAYALVGTIGAVSTGASGASVTPAWGTGENRNANNLLVALVSQNSGAGLTATPSGWTLAKSVGTTTFVAIFYKIASGSDSAPTFAGVTGAILSAQLAEFSGNVSSSPLDQTGSALGSTSPQTATFAATDLRSGELLLISSFTGYSAVNSATISLTSNNATVTNAGTDGASGTGHFQFGYGVTTSNSSADTATATASTSTNIALDELVAASFLVAPSPVGSKLIITQAVKRASFF
jgi:hypothetical protein